MWHVSRRLTFCCRHSLQALFTPGCLRRSFCSSVSFSPLPGELSSPALFRVLFRLRAAPGWVAVGLVVGVNIPPSVKETPLFLGRPDGALGGRFMSRKEFRVTPSNAPTPLGDSDGRSRRRNNPKLNLIGEVPENPCRSPPTPAHPQ